MAYYCPLGPGGKVRRQLRDLGERFEDVDVGCECGDEEKCEGL